MAVLLACGCGGAGDGETVHPVKGRILQNGAALKINLPANAPPGDPGVELQLISASSKTVFPATVGTSDGTFSVGGQKGKGIPAGKYKVAFRLGVRGQGDDSKNPLTAEKTPLVVDVPGTGEVVLEVGTKPSVKWE